MKNIDILNICIKGKWFLYFYFYTSVQVLFVTILITELNWDLRFIEEIIRQGKGLNSFHLDTKLVEVLISNGLVFKWWVYVLCPMYKTDYSNIGPVHKKSRWRLFVRYSNGWAVRYSNGNWKPDHLASNLFSTIWIPNKFGILIPAVI